MGPGYIATIMTATILEDNSRARYVSDACQTPGKFFCFCILYLHTLFLLSTESTCFTATPTPGREMEQQGGRWKAAATNMGPNDIRRRPLGRVFFSSMFF